jgi:hypothetical protein
MPIESDPPHLSTVALAQTNLPVITGGDEDAVHPVFLLMAPRRGITFHMGVRGRSGHGNAAISIPLPTVELLPQFALQQLSG